MVKLSHQTVRYTLAHTESQRRHTGCVFSVTRVLFGIVNFRYLQEHLVGTVTALVVVSIWLSRKASWGLWPLKSTRAQSRGRLTLWRELKFGAK